MAPTRFTLRSCAMIFVLLSLFASACGSSGSGDAASDNVATAEDSESDADSSDDAGGDSDDDDSNDDGGDTNDSGDIKLADSPLDEFLGVPSFDPSDAEASQAQFEEQERARQEAIAACMRAEGFEYTPTDPSQYSFFEDEDGPSWGSKEWVEKFGYGVTTMAFSQSEVGPDLIGYDDSQFGNGAFDPEDDPNFAYTQSLSEAEQEAYEEALYGDQPEFDPETMTDEEINAVFENHEFTGCQNEGQLEGDFGKQQAFYQEFGDEMDAMYEAMESDPRVLEAEAKIEACVIDKGAEYVSEQDSYEFYEDALEPMRSRLYGQFDDAAISGPDVESMSEEELEEFYNNLPQPELTAEDKVVLAELQQEEITSAVASFECGGGFENQIELFNDLRIDYEQRFLDDNRAALEAFAESN